MQDNRVNSTDAIDGWVNVNALIMLAGTAAVYVLNSTLSIIVSAIFSFSILILQRRQSIAVSSIFQRYAHQLTLIRLTLLCVAAYSIAYMNPTWLLLLFSANVLLDIADGWIARRLNQATRFGMVFDRETDAFFVLVACIYFNIRTNVPPWILLPALLPYLYRLLAWALGNPPIAAKKQPLAALLAGVNFGLILLAVAIAPAYQLVVLVISTSIVTLSFLVSFRDLFRYQHENTFFQ